MTLSATTDDSAESFHFSEWCQVVWAAAIKICVLGDARAKSLGVRSKRLPLIPCCVCIMYEFCSISLTYLRSESLQHLRLKVYRLLCHLILPLWLNRRGETGLNGVGWGG